MGQPVRVLVVDEDRDVRELTETFLERGNEDFEVETAPSAREARERIEAGAVDAVVSDLRMPGTDGLELAETLDELGHDPVFVLFSAANDPETAAAVDESTVDQFVLKGSGTDHYEEIAAAIRDGLDR